MTKPIRRISKIRRPIPVEDIKEFARKFIEDNQKMGYELSGVPNEVMIGKFPVLKGRQARAYYRNKLRREKAFDFKMNRSAFLWRPLDEPKV